MERIRRTAAEKAGKTLLTAKEECEGSLLAFVRYFWHIVEPVTVLVEGWPLEAICEHLEAISYGFIQKLLINVPPGSMKSLLVNVFFPAWEWATGRAHKRYVTFSYSAGLTQRDNRRFGAIVSSREYQSMFGDAVEIVKLGEEIVSNTRTGWKLATSVGGLGTGERGDVVTLDDPIRVSDANSDTIREYAKEWFSGSMLNRLNDMDKSSIIVIMQRVHEDDVSGFILAKELDFVHLMIPAEYDSSRHCRTSIGWSDPRTEDGEFYWPARFPNDKVVELKRGMSAYDWSSQYQQRPAPKGGGIFKRAWWRLWDKPNYPQFDFVLASLDPAYTTKEMNDPSGFTVWGIWHENGLPKIMLVRAWRKRLEIVGEAVDPKRDDETVDDFTARQRAAFGLVEWCNYSCTRKPAAELLLIEAKASGISVAQTLRKLYALSGFGVVLVNVPRSLDKVARAYSVQHMFSDGSVYAPDKDWADMVITEAEMFPKGKYDDLVDSLTQAMSWLRTNGFVQRSEEIAADDMAAMMHTGREVAVPLYDT